MVKSKKDLIDQFSELYNSSRYIKVTGIVLGSIVVIFISGYIFKMLANTVRGFTDFKNSLNGN